MPLRYTIQEVAAFCGGSLIRAHDSGCIINRIFTDSRSHIIPAGSLFFALRGERHDGHRYLPDLAARGVTNFVISDSGKLASMPLACNVIAVEDTLSALQQLAAHHRSRFDCPVAGITGSNGKTIVKEWLSQLIPPNQQVVRSPMSYNSQVGVPLSVLQMDENHTIALFEAGISRPGEMENLTRIIQPTLGIFTGIGAAHDENFSSRRQKTLEKLILFRNAADLICFNDDPETFTEVKAFAEKHKIRLFTIGTSPDATLWYAITATNEKEVALTTRWKGREIRVILPFSDQASVRNGLLCLGVMLFLGCPADSCPEKIRKLEPVAMRMEQVEGLQNCVIINDSYNNDLLALKIALDHLRHQNIRPRKCLILSDIFQSGLDQQAMTAHLSQLINSYSPDRFIGIGESVAALKDQIQCESWFYSTTDQFVRYHPFSVFRDEVILLKGARSFGFERIRDLLQRKSHQTILEINLEALVYNLNFFRSKLAPETEIMAMVKASSYGAGSFEIASTLQYHQVACLAVAYADEGVELRKAGITLPVMVMNPEELAFDQMIAHQLEPELYSFPILKSFIRVAEPYYQASRVPYPVHIEMDTGMHRLGFNPEETQLLIQILHDTPSISVRSVFSHLATADNLHDADYTRHQIEIFDKIREDFYNSVSPLPLFHILNSAGILNYPEAQFDMVRPGIGLYGIIPGHPAQASLRQVFRLKSVVSQVRKIAAGDAVGYNRAFTATLETIVATIAIGYADGFSRKLGRGVGKVRVRGHFAPVIGDVCMDMIMVDVTDIPGVIEGDEVIIFDEHYPVPEMAALLGTIPYEVLTSISGRVKRVYLNEG